MRYFLTIWFLIAASHLFAEQTEEKLFSYTGLAKAPVSYLGRYRPAEVAMHLWLQEFHPASTGEDKEKAKALFWQLRANEKDTHMAYTKAFTNLTEHKLAPTAKASQLEQAFPLFERLAEEIATTSLESPGHLPAKNDPSLWYPLSSLDLPYYNWQRDTLTTVPNFTAYSDEAFEEIRRTYSDLRAVLSSNNHATEEADALGIALLQGYREIAGQSYFKAANSTLAFPSLWQLKAESLYYHLPLLNLALLLYIGAAIAYTLGWLYLGTGTTLGAWIVHTGILLLRIYILERPPVSNMYETLLFVPWVATTAALAFVFWNRSYCRMAMIAATATAATLLAIARLGPLADGFDNVQAVLNSQYWLIIHVLLVVGSYGLFLLGGVTAHMYLFVYSKSKTAKALNTLTLITICGGVLLLIPGTILGGIWAAQSWGRFWDWDPKESWAFITSCTYLFTIHAYRYQLISPRGLALGAIVGAWSTSFTWYGVNYLLGRGLHSYGFGSGGEWYYATILFLDMIAVTYLAWNSNTDRQLPGIY